MSENRFLLDTTVWVSYLRGLDAHLKDRVSSLVLEDRVYITDIIILELLRGARSEREYSILLEDLLALPHLPITDEVWKSSWKLAYTLQKKGVNIPLADTLIAAVSISYDCTLLHKDSHYPLIAKHAPLRQMEV